MPFATHRIVARLVGALVLTAISSASAQGPAAGPFSPGEILTYDVTWSIFRAGEVSASLQSVAGGSKDAYEVKTTARSQGFVSLLFDVNDDFLSLFDPQSACSIRISKKINEGRRRKDTQIVFDSHRRLAILDERDLTKPTEPPKHAEHDIPPCVQDVISAFYYVRRQDLQVGQTFHVPVSDGSKTYDVTVEVQAKEKVQTPLGTREAFRVEPKAFDGLIKRKGRMLIWFSADEQRLPLRIKAMIAVGSITGTLRSVASPPPGSSRSQPPPASATP